MSIYTRTGDDGQTSLADGQRVPKSSSRVEAYGTIDEAISWVGLARASVSTGRLEEVLRFLQQRLMNCASAIAAPGTSAGAPASSIDQADVDSLEQLIDEFSAAAGPLNGFVLPAGSETSARLHVARTVVRRAERRVASLAQTEAVHAAVLAFLNRASDLLFAAARYSSELDGIADEAWDPRAAAPR